MVSLFLLIHNNSNVPECSIHNSTYYGEKRFAYYCLINKFCSFIDKVFCYYGSWAVYRQGDGKFDVEQIDPKLCTHIIYSFVGVGEDGSVTVKDAWNDLEENWGKGAFKRFVKLRELNPALKALVAIGGWNEGATRFSQV